MTIRKGIELRADVAAWGIYLDADAQMDDPKKGLRLDLKGANQTIPVSRSYVPRIREAIGAK